MSEEKTIEITKEEFEKMPKEKQIALWRKAIKIKGTAVVRRADGSIKYDDPEQEAKHLGVK